MIFDSRLTIKQNFQSPIQTVVNIKFSIILGGNNGFTNNMVFLMGPFMGLIFHDGWIRFWDWNPISILRKE